VAFTLRDSRTTLENHKMRACPMTPRSPCASCAAPCALPEVLGQLGAGRHPCLGRRVKLMSHRQAFLARLPLPSCDYFFQAGGKGRLPGTCAVQSKTLGRSGGRAKRTLNTARGKREIPAPLIV
jgi:hypothetical protein